jgi:hypothetical protein
MNPSMNMNVNSNEPAYWYVLSDGIEQGPMNVTEIMEGLKAGTLNEDSLVRLDAWEKTVRLARLGGAEEMRRLERGREPKKAGDLFLADDPVMQDAEVVRLEKRLRWVRWVEWIGVVVIASVAVSWTVQTARLIGHGTIWLAGAVYLVTAVVGWVLFCSIVAGVVSGALSSRCLWLDRREQRRVEKGESKPGGV